MLSETSVMFEFLIANRALVRHFLGVGSHVNNKSGLMGKPLTTYLALEFFFPCMCSKMCVQRIFPTKLLVADRTLKTHLPCMQSKMTSEISSLGKLLIANFALIRFRFQVYY